MPTRLQRLQRCKWQWFGELDKLNGCESNYIDFMKIRLRTGYRIARPRSQAFTLVELLLVLVILGILAAIVIPKFSGRTEQAKEQAAVTQIATFRTALDAFEVDNGYYPKGKNGLDDLIIKPRDAQNWRGPYLQTDKIPLDPWGPNTSMSARDGIIQPPTTLTPAGLLAATK